MITDVFLDQKRANVCEHAVNVTPFDCFGKVSSEWVQDRNAGRSWGNGGKIEWTMIFIRCEILWKVLYTCPCILSIVHQGMQISCFPFSVLTIITSKVPRQVKICCDNLICRLNSLHYTESKRSRVQVLVQAKKIYK